MSELTNEKKRALAERMFIHDGMTCKAIAGDLDVSEQTLSRWRKGREGEKDWDLRRSQHLAAPHVLRELLLKELQVVAEGNKSNIDADALIKISKVIEALSDKVSVQLVLSVFKEFDNWMVQQDPKAAISFLPWHKQFLLYKASIE